MQTSLAPQATQVPPPSPQALVWFPGWHCPASSVQVVQMEMLQVPVALQIVPLPHAVQLKPALPHAWAVVPGLQLPVESQHPGQVVEQSLDGLQEQPSCEAA
jgi:hypothetical protein